MAHASTWEDLAPGLGKGVERAQRAPEGRFHALAPWIEVPALARASRRQRADAVVGVDGVTKEQDGRARAAHLQGRHARLQAPRDRPPPIRRVPIPQGAGKTRPMGRSAGEATLVQDAVREGLAALDEPDVLDGSSGVRPGRSAHDAIRILDQIVHRGALEWILEAAIGSFFDSLDRTALKKMLAVRVADGSLWRRIDQGVHVGGRDGEAVVEPELGTAQGAVVTPLLGNVSRHEVLARWCETAGKPRLRGTATLSRYGDACLIGFEREDEARRGRAGREKRRGRFGRARHPDKPRRWPLGRPPQGQQRGTGPAPFDCWGFPCDGARSRQGRGGMGGKTRRASRRRAKPALDDWGRRPRHQPGKAQHAARRQRVRGHCKYCGVRGNVRRLLRLVDATKRAWDPWLGRRSPRLTWERCGDGLPPCPRPRPRLTVRIWGE